MEKHSQGSPTGTSTRRLRRKPLKRTHLDLMLNQQRHRCAYCHEPFVEVYALRSLNSDDCPTAEHINPRNNGGEDSIENYALVHGRCNLADRYELGMAVMLHRNAIRFRKEVLDFPSIKPIKDEGRLSALVVGDVKIVVLPHYISQCTYLPFIYRYHRIAHILDHHEHFPNVRIVVNQTDAENVIRELLEKKPADVSSQQIPRAPNMLSKDDQYLLENDMLRPPGTTHYDVREHYCQEMQRIEPEVARKGESVRRNIEHRKHLKELRDRFEEKQERIRLANLTHEMKMKEISLAVQKERESLRDSLLEKQGGKCAFCQEPLSRPKNAKLKSINGETVNEHNAVVVHNCCSVKGHHATGLAVILHNHGIRFTFNTERVRGNNPVEFLHLIDFDLNIAVLKSDTRTSKAVRNAVERLHAIADNPQDSSGIVVVSTYKEIMEVVRTITDYADRHDIDYRHEMDSNMKGFGFVELYRAGMIRRPCDTVKHLYHKKMKEAS